MTTLLELPTSSRSSISVLNAMGVKRFGQLSERILSRLPIVPTPDSHSGFSFDERAALVAAFAELTPTQIDHMLATAVRLWQQIAFHRPKPSVLTSDLRTLGFADELVAAIADLWTRFRTDVLERLSSCSMSGAPQLQDVTWALHTALASSDCNKMREPYVRLELRTDQGAIRSEMNYEALKTLYDTLQDVQKAVDSLTRQG